MPQIILNFSDEEIEQLKKRLRLSSYTSIEAYLRALIDTDMTSDELLTDFNQALWDRTDNEAEFREEMKKDD